MRSSITTQDVVNAVRLAIRHPSSSNKVFVLVEGDSDVKSLKKFFQPFVEINMIPGGVEKVLEALHQLRADTKRLLAIRDLDFSFLLSPGVSAVDIISTDSHDIEMTMLGFDDCLLALLSEFLSSHVHQVPTVRKRIFDCLKFYSYCKLANAEHGLELNFKGFPFGTVYDKSRVELDSQAVLAELNLRSPNRKRDLTLLEVQSTATRHSGLPDELLVSGHDFVQIFAFFCGSNGQSSVSARTVDSTLRASFTLGHFKTTRIHTDLCGWASSIGQQIVV